MAHKITFVGDPRARAEGKYQKSFGPHWRRGLKPGESVILDQIPDSCVGSQRHQFLVDGKPYDGPAPEKPKPAPRPAPAKREKEK